MNRFFSIHVIQETKGCTFGPSLCVQVGPENSWDYKLQDSILIVVLGWKFGTCLDFWHETQ